MTGRNVWAAIVIVGMSSAADEPKPDAGKPQYQRMLSGDEAKKAAGLEQRMTFLENLGKRPEALKAAEELLALRTRLQGENHWQVRDARLRADDLRRPLTAEQQGKLAEARRLTDQVVRLEE